MTKWQSALFAFFVPAALAAAGAGPSASWWSPGQGTPLPGFATYDNAQGQLGVLNTAGPLDTKGHPFFEPIGTNGRACVTCHQPSDGMSISVRSIRERWAATGGTDPLFAAVDGMNCPGLPPGDPRSHSLLLDRGLFRIALPWPSVRPDGTRIDPEFTIEVVRDPSGCNTDPRYGLNSATPTISVFRRPRPAANTKYTTHQNFGVGPFIGKNAMPASTDPATGKPTSMNLMSDARAATLGLQAEDAARSHLQIAGKLSAFAPNRRAWYSNSAATSSSVILIVKPARTTSNARRACWQATRVASISLLSLTMRRRSTRFSVTTICIFGSAFISDC